MSEQPLGTRIDGRTAFADAVRRVLAEAAEHGWRELHFSDPDFVDWPLDDAAVLAALAAWSRPHRRLVVLASHYDEVPRRHPRWTAWRRVWSHAVSCRQAAPEVPAGEIPVLLLVPGECVLRLFDRAWRRGVVATSRTDVARAKLDFDALLQHSNEAFAPTTLGI